MKINQKGFGVVEILLVFVIIGLIGGTGYYVYNSQKKTNTALDNTANSQSEPQKSEDEEDNQETVDETADWATFSSEDGHFSLKHPKSWVKAKNPELCAPGLLLLGANSASVGKCASEGFGQIAVNSSEGNMVSEFEMKKADYSDLVTEEVVADGVTGKKQTGSYSGAVGGIGPVKGDKQVVYLFFAKNRTYSATYSVNDTYPDVLSDFNLMVTKTLKFE